MPATDYEAAILLPRARRRARAIDCPAGGSGDPPPSRAMARPAPSPAPHRQPTRYGDDRGAGGTPPKTCGAAESPRSALRTPRLLTIASTHRPSFHSGPANSTRPAWSELPTSVGRHPQVMGLASSRQRPPEGRAPPAGTADGPISTPYSGLEIKRMASEYCLNSDQRGPLNWAHDFRRRSCLGDAERQRRARCRVEGISGFAISGASRGSGSDRVGGKVRFFSRGR